MKPLLDGRERVVLAAEGAKPLEVLGTGFAFGGPLASEGAVLNSADVNCRIGSHTVDYVDGTGGGDAFAAGYIYGLLNDANAEQCLRFGSALGASSVRTRGATTGVFSRDELEAFVSEHRLPIASVGT